MGQLSNLNIGFVFLLIFDWCSFKLFVASKPDFDCSSSFVLSCIYKVTSGT